MLEVRFLQKAVRRVLRSLEVKMSSGPDGIPAIVLQTCSTELSPVLARLLTLSYRLCPDFVEDRHCLPNLKKGGLN